MSICPCRAMDADNSISYENCCKPYLEGKKKAPTAEALMRSRYTAYTLGNMDYIEKTQTHVEGETFNKEEALQWAQNSEWKGLKIHKTDQGLENDKQGIVEFSAHYQDKKSQKDLEHRERSLFEKASDGWKFKSGQISGTTITRLEPKVGRNDPCTCGSGKKFKKCCGA